MKKTQKEEFIAEARKEICDTVIPEVCKAVADAAIYGKGVIGKSCDGIRHVPFVPEKGQENFLVQLPQRNRAAKMNDEAKRKRKERLLRDRIEHFKRIIVVKNIQIKNFRNHCRSIEKQLDRAKSKRHGQAKT